MRAPSAIAGPLHESRLAWRSASACRLRRQASCSGPRAAVSGQGEIAIPPEGFGSRLDQIIAWLDANCGADGWTSTPSSTRGVVNDSPAVYFLDATIASAFVARWCAAQRIEIVDGVYRVRDDELTARVGAGLRKTP